MFGIQVAHGVGVRGEEGPENEPMVVNSSTSARFSLVSSC